MAHYPRGNGEQEGAWTTGVGPAPVGYHQQPSTQGWLTDSNWGTPPPDYSHVDTGVYPGQNYSQYGVETGQTPYGMNGTGKQSGVVNQDQGQDMSSAMDDPQLYRMTSMGQPEDPLTEFTEQTLRRGFIRKVFAILAVQLLVTFGFIALFVLVDTVKEFAQEHTWMLIASSITTLVISIALCCSESLRRKYPQNLICLVIFTLAEAWLLGTVSSFCDVDEVLMATGICAAVTTVMCLFGLQSKIDFTVITGALISITLCLLGFGILCLIFQSRYMQLMYASLGALVFSLWITVDVQLVMGKGKYELDSEEYILAALNIYLDIITLFLFLLQIINGNK